MSVFVLIGHVSVAEIPAVNSNWSESLRNLRSPHGRGEIRKVLPPQTDWSAKPLRAPSLRAAVSPLAPTTPLAKTSFSAAGNTGALHP